MTYPEKISKNKQELDTLVENMEKFRQVLRTINVGDTIYLAGGHGGWDVEYFPQIVREVNVEDCYVRAYEESMKKETKFTEFHKKEGDNFIYYY